VSFLQRWPKILLPILWWPIAVRIDVVYWLLIVVLAIVVARGPRGFVWFQSFPLLLELAKMLDFRLTKFCNLFIELRHYFELLPD
jgi:hypothetical protein